MDENSSSEILLWRKRANELADKLIEVQRLNTLYVEALQKIQHTGYADDAWVSIATKVLALRN